MITLTPDDTLSALLMNTTELLHLDVSHNELDALPPQLRRLTNIQVSPLTQFFLFPFCEKSLICLEGKSITLHLENIFSSVPPSNSLVSVSDT